VALLLCELCWTVPWPWSFEPYTVPIHPTWGEQGLPLLHTISNAVAAVRLFPYTLVCSMQWHSESASMQTPKMYLTASAALSHLQSCL
jgi:hypothetical protein